MVRRVKTGKMSFCNIGLITSSVLLNYALIITFDISLFVSTDLICFDFNSDCLPQEALP